MRKFTGAALTAVLFLPLAPAASASETIVYTYDAKARLVTVTHSGSVNNGVQSTYAHDKADNRSNVKITGAP
jgi:hypothetical protein